MTWTCDSCGWVNTRKRQCENCETRQGQVREVARVYKQPTEPYNRTGPRKWIFAPAQSVQLDQWGMPWG
jgi:hypothetical protein